MAFNFQQFSHSGFINVSVRGLEATGFRAPKADGLCQVTKVSPITAFIGLGV
jgi:hypothetical protein